MTNDEDLYAQREYNTGAYSDSTDYIPTDAAVRSSYATDYYMVEVAIDGSAVGRAAAFDRWMAEHDRVIRAAAWDEAHTAIAAHYSIRGGVGPDNPYRDPATCKESARTFTHPRDL